jgi:hypothetical protein
MDMVSIKRGAGFESEGQRYGVSRVVEIRAIAIPRLPGRYEAHKDGKNMTAF